MFGVATAMLLVYTAQCKREKITLVLPFLLTAALETTKIVQKHTLVINKLCNTSRNDNDLLDLIHTTCSRNAMTIDMVEILK